MEESIEFLEEDKEAFSTQIHTVQNCKKSFWCVVSGFPGYITYFVGTESQKNCETDQNINDDFENGTRIQDLAFDIVSRDVSGSDNADFSSTKSPFKSLEQK